MANLARQGVIDHVFNSERARRTPVPPSGQTINGLGDDDTLYGDTSIMDSKAHGGNDTLNGGVGNDTLYGDAQFYFPTSLGSITGGTDILKGGASNDQLWGGPNEGNSAVGSTATEHDIINLQDYHFADWGTLQGKITEVSGNAVIQHSANDSITLVGVDFNDLHQTDFII